MRKRLLLCRQYAVLPYRRRRDVPVRFYAAYDRPLSRTFHPRTLGKNDSDGAIRPKGKIVQNAGPGIQEPVYPADPAGRPVSLSVAKFFRWKSRLTIPLS